jgi:hypothetical protein
MRSLFVSARVAGIVAAAALSSGAAPPVAMHPGNPITEEQLFGYLAFPVHPGDWMRYRVDFAGGTTALKTVGFGTESVGGQQTLFIETHVRALPVTGLPAGSTTGVGTDAVLKTYVAGNRFGDLSTPYKVITSALKIANFEYEVTPASPETYTALAGDVYSPPRSGTIQSVEPVDVQIGGQTTHATHVVATFGPIALPVGGVSTGFSIEVWQSPDVPGGTVAIASPGLNAVRWRLVAFGRGNYRSLFKNTLDEIRADAQPTML